MIKKDKNNPSKRFLSGQVLWMIHNRLTRRKCEYHRKHVSKPENGSEKFTLKISLPQESIHSLKPSQLQTTQEEQFISYPLKDCHKLRLPAAAWGKNVPLSLTKKTDQISGTSLVVQWLRIQYRRHGFDSWLGTKIPQTTEQLIPRATTRAWAALQQKMLHDATQILCAATKTQQSQINKCLKIDQIPSCPSPFKDFAIR